MFLEMRQAIGYPLTILSRLVKWKLGAEKLRYSIDEGKPLPCQKGGGTILRIKPGEYRLIFKKLQLTGRTCHVQVDGPLRAGRKLRRQRSQRVAGIASQIEPRRAV